MSSFNTALNEDHSRIIVHIDLDCFYAQVEMIKNPSLRNLPLGVQQKNLVVTSNYVARECGVKKCMSVGEAKRVCPELVLVKGEDLYDYRKISYQVTAYLQKYSSLVERLGLDENYVDVTDAVNERLKTGENVNLYGHVFAKVNEVCGCGCVERLKIGSALAQEIRKGIFEELQLTSCAGIAHNKLLAKLVGAVHKPNQQTTIFPDSALELMLTLNICDIPGVGHTMTEILENLNIRSISDLHNCNFEILKSAVSSEKAQWLVDASYGRDATAVKPSGKPLSIGLEDSCKSISVETEIREKFQVLLTRLIVLVCEDGRLPTTIKVTVRKFDSGSKVSHRETRQCNIHSNLFVADLKTNTLHFNEKSENKLLSIIMHLFSKMVNTSQPYHITLLGLSFTKFQERFSGKSSIASYFVKDLAVQSITSIESTTTSVQNFAQRSLTSARCDYNTDGSETEMEPSPKKSRCATFVSSNSNSDYSSPSKLRVADLRLNSTEGDTTDGASTNSNSSSDSNLSMLCPPDADKEVFRQLPTDMQRELWEEWKRERERDNADAKSNKQVKRAKTNTILNYFQRN